MPGLSGEAKTRRAAAHVRFLEDEVTRLFFEMLAGSNLVTPRQGKEGDANFWTNHFCLPSESNFAIRSTALGRDL